MSGDLCVGVPPSHVRKNLLFTDGQSWLDRCIRIGTQQIGIPGICRFAGIGQGPAVRMRVNPKARLLDNGPQ